MIKLLNETNEGLYETIKNDFIDGLSKISANGDANGLNKIMTHIKNNFDLRLGKFYELVFISGNNLNGYTVLRESQSPSYDLIDVDLETVIKYLNDNGVLGEERRIKKIIGDLNNNQLSFHIKKH